MNDITLAIKVMTYDIDFAGIVSNISYVRWLEDLRLAVAEQRLALGDAFARGIAPVLMRTEIDYLAPVRYPDTVDGRMWMEQVGPIRWTLAAEFTSRATGRVTARARQSGVFISLATLQPIRLPKEYRP